GAGTIADLHSQANRRSGGAGGLRAVDAEAPDRLFGGTHRGHSPAFLTMQLDIDPAWALAVFFTAVRLGTILLMSPILAGLSGLVTVRVLLSIALAGLLVQGLDVRPPHDGLQLGAIVSGACNELVVGGTLAFGVFAAFGS